MMFGSPVAIAPPYNSRRPSLGTWILVLGLAGTLFVWVPGPPLRPDQFSLPKDIALGALGVVCALLLLPPGRQRWLRGFDLPLVAVLGWGALSASVTAANPHLAWRAVGQLSAGFLVMIYARRTGRIPGGSLAYGIVCAVLFFLTSIVLLEAYGPVPFFSELGRRPGATLGNRNLVGRLLCLGLPVLWRQTLAARRRWDRDLIAGLLAMTSATIVLSRSRGAWLIASGVVSCVPLAWCALRSPMNARMVRLLVRRWGLPILLGGLLAAVLPNRMGWQLSDFSNSVRRSFAYDIGSGRGRVIQSQTTLRMIFAAPLGVGPGNWSVNYPAFAEPGDPSYTPEALYPAPRVPRGDLLSLTAEFGLPALALCLLGAYAIVRHAAVMLRGPRGSTRISGLTLLAVCGIMSILGVLDPVLRLSPTLALVAVLIGLSLSDTPLPVEKHGFATNCLDLSGSLLIGLMGVTSSISAIGAGRDLVAQQLVHRVATPANLLNAVAIAPNNLEVRLSLAYVLVTAKRCDLAIPILARSARLQPFAPTVFRLLSACSDTSAEARTRKGRTR